MHASPFNQRLISQGEKGRENTLPVKQPLDLYSNYIPLVTNSYTYAARYTKHIESCNSRNFTDMWEQQKGIVLLRSLSRELQHYYRSYIGGLPYQLQLNSQLHYSSLKGVARSTGQSITLMIMFCSQLFHSLGKVCIYL